MRRRSEQDSSDERAASEAVEPTMISSADATQPAESDRPLSVGRQAVRGGAVTLGGQWVRYGLQVGSLVVLSRLLAPEDFGILGMVTAIIALGETIRDAGLTNGAIQRETLTHAEQSTLFYIN